VARHYDALAAAARSGRIEVVQEPTRGRVSPGAQPVSECLEDNNAASVDGVSCSTAQ